MLLMKSTISLLLVMAAVSTAFATIIDIHGMNHWNDQLEKAGKSLTVVQFQVKWCSYCRYMKPIFIDIANQQQHRGVLFLSVDVDENREIGWKNGISSVPTYKYYKNGTAIDSVSTINPMVISGLIYRLK